MRADCYFVGAERTSKHSNNLQGRVSANGRVGATAAVYSAAILGALLFGRP